MFYKKRILVFITIACLFCLGVFLFNPLQSYYYMVTQGLLEDEIFHEKGYTITQNQTISAQFIFNPTWIPQKLGQHNHLHYVFYNKHNTDIFVSDVYKRNDGIVYVEIDSKSKYVKKGGDFVSSIVVHDETNSLSYGWIPFRPQFIDPNSGKEVSFEYGYGIGTGPKNLLSFYVDEKESKVYLSRPLVIKIIDFNLITYTKN